MRPLAGALLLFLAACAGTKSAPQPAPPAAAAASVVEVVRDGDAWTADFAFDRDAAAWMFPRSPLASRDDVDELGHVNNAVWVRWMQDIATGTGARRRSLRMSTPMAGS